MPSNDKNNRDDWSRDDRTGRDRARNAGARNDYSSSDNDSLGQSSRSGRGGSWSNRDDDASSGGGSQGRENRGRSMGGRSNGDMGADSWGGASDRDTGRDRYNSDRDSSNDGYSGNRSINEDNYGSGRSGQMKGQSDRYTGREGGSNQFTSWQNNPSDTQRGQHAGRGPKGYRRDDVRITEDVNEALTHDAHIDASEIEVQVSGGEVTLSGTVDSRDAKRHAEDIVERVSGVNEVHNQIKVSKG